MSRCSVAGADVVGNELAMYSARATLPALQDTVGSAGAIGNRSCAFDRSRAKLLLALRTTRKFDRRESPTSASIVTVTWLHAHQSPRSPCAAMWATGASLGPFLRLGPLSPIPGISQIFGTWTATTELI